VPDREARADGEKGELIDCIAAGTPVSLTDDRVAVITSAASGIGLAAAKRFASMGLRVCNCRSRRKCARTGSYGKSHPPRNAAHPTGRSRRRMSASWRRVQQRRSRRFSPVTNQVAANPKARISAFSSSAVKVTNSPRAYSYPLTTRRLSISSPVAGSCGRKRDPGGCGALVSIKAGIVDEEPRRRWRRTLLPFTLIGPSVLGHIDRRWLPHLVQANGFRALRSAR
jgi:hypothetical protein